MVCSCGVRDHRTDSHEGFVRLVERHRPELRAHCQRMLRSHDDAEDAVQEALLRAWNRRSSFAGRGSARSWLFRIATNAALDTMRRRRKLVLSIEPEGERAGLIESIADDRPLTESRYEQREAVNLALYAAERLLPARQRAVLVLRDVLGFSAAESAEILDTTVASVNSALQRARATIDGWHSRLSLLSERATNGKRASVAYAVGQAVSR
jgi:RNA polymerase sigma-70 factor (ECF subfamily)